MIWPVTIEVFPVIWDSITHAEPVATIARPYLAERFVQVLDYLGLFALGMLAATVAYSRGAHWTTALKRIPWWSVAAMAAIVLVTDFARYGPNMGNQMTLLADVLTAGVTLTLFLAAARAADGIISRIMGWRPLALTGTYAYCIYFMHAPILAVLYAYVFTPYLAPGLDLHGVPATYALIVFVLPIVLGSPTDASDASSDRS